MAPDTTPQASNLNAWDPWYGQATVPVPYGDTPSYQAAAEWLSGLDVEDWGCGYAWFRQFHNAGYIGVDGTRSRWCDIHADLENYRSSTPGLLLRHVLEHNRGWRTVLDNAVASYSERMCVVLFTPLAESTEVLEDNVAGLGVPDIAFRLEDILARIPGSPDVETVPSACAYGVETIIRAAR